MTRLQEVHRLAAVQTHSCAGQCVGWSRRGARDAALELGRLAGLAASLFVFPPGIVFTQHFYLESKASFVRNPITSSSPPGPVSCRLQLQLLRLREVEWIGRAVFSRSEPSACWPAGQEGSTEEVTGRWSPDGIPLPSDQIGRGAVELALRGREERLGGGQQTTLWSDRLLRLGSNVT